MAGRAWSSRAGFATLGQIAFRVVSPERHRPMASCAADRAQRVAAAPQVLHDVDSMHPQPVGKRPYGNSLGVIENNDVDVARTLPLGNVSSENKTDEEGNRLIWLDRAMVDRLRSLRGDGERFSDVILRLASEGG
jgi:hypothetical protein